MKRPIEKPLCDVSDKSIKFLGSVRHGALRNRDWFGTFCDPTGGPWEGRDPRDPRDPAEMEIRFSEEDELAQSVAEMEAHLESPWFAIFFWSFFLGEMVWKWYEMENRAPKSQGLYFWYKLQVDGLGPFLTKV